MADTQVDVTQLSQEVQAKSEPFRRLLEEIGRVIVGQDDMLHKMLIGLLSNGHILLEGLPGLAKTVSVSCLARAIDTGFQRIQFTPDLLPADVLGTMV